MSERVRKVTRHIQPRILQLPIRCYIRIQKWASQVAIFSSLISSQDTHRNDAFDLCSMTWVVTWTYGPYAWTHGWRKYSLICRKIASRILIENYKAVRHKNTVTIVIKISELVVSPWTINDHIRKLCHPWIHKFLSASAYRWNDQISMLYDESLCTSTNQRHEFVVSGWLCIT